MKRFFSILCAAVCIGFLIWRVPQVIDLEIHGERTTGVVTGYETTRGFHSPVITMGGKGREREIPLRDTAWLWRHYAIGEPIPLLIGPEPAKPVAGGPLLRWYQLVVFGIVLFVSIITILIPHHDPE